MTEDVQRTVLGHLDELGIDYEVIPCDPEYADTAAFCERYGYPLERSANTIVVASKRPKGRLAACVLLAITRLDVNRRVCEIMGVSKASFASPEEVEERTGMAIGGVTVLGLPDELPILVDARVAGLDWIILGAGSRTAKIKTSPRVFDHLPEARVVSDLAVEG